MTSKWRWLIKQLTRKLWFRASLFAVLAVITALVAIATKSFIPSSLSGLVGTEAVDEILTILASSMLAVTTFSLNIMVSAYNAASSSVTPRATRLLVEDHTTQNVLATFIGSFLYSLVGIIALNMGAYGKEGRVVLFFVTLTVIVTIVITLLRWIQHLAQFGHMGETAQRVENATSAALLHRLKNPYLGGLPWNDRVLSTDNASAVYPEQIGYLQHIDMQILADYAEQYKVSVYIACQPGSFTQHRAPLLWLCPVQTERDADRLRSAFTIRPERSFDQDPRFGLCVLSEIASRALSPAVNDPGTAIDIIGRAVRVLASWNSHPATAPQVSYPRLFLRPLETRDLLDDMFTAIARDGAGLIEVQIRLQKALKTLEELDPATFANPARHHALQALARAEASMAFEADKQTLRTLVMNNLG